MIHSITIRNIDIGKKNDIDHPRYEILSIQYGNRPKNKGYKYSRVYNNPIYFLARVAKLIYDPPVEFRTNKCRNMAMQVNEWSSIMTPEYEIVPYRRKIDNDMASDRYYHFINYQLPMIINPVRISDYSYTIDSFSRTAITISVCAIYGKMEDGFEVETTKRIMKIKINMTRMFLPSSIRFEFDDSILFLNRIKTITKDVVNFYIRFAIDFLNLSDAQVDLIVETLLDSIKNKKGKVEDPDSICEVEYSFE